MKDNNWFFLPDGKYKILLAEDDEDDFYFFNMAVSSIPGTFEILRTSNGIMLSSLLQSSVKFDAIFLDINMPFKNGLSCLKEIRNNPALNSTQVIMYTTSNHPRDIDACYCLGANFYLPKPNNFRLGVEQLKSLISNPYFQANQIPPRSLFVIDLNSDAQKHSNQNAVNVLVA